MQITLQPRILFMAAVVALGGCSRTDSTGSSGATKDAPSHMSTPSHLGSGQRTGSDDGRLQEKRIPVFLEFINMCDKPATFALVQDDGQRTEFTEHVIWPGNRIMNPNGRVKHGMKYRAIMNPNGDVSHAVVLGEFTADEKRHALAQVSISCPWSGVSVSLPKVSDLPPGLVKVMTDPPGKNP